jgi:hypothetical protein
MDREFYKYVAPTALAHSGMVSTKQTGGLRYNHGKFRPVRDEFAG